MKDIILYQKELLNFTIEEARQLYPEISIRITRNNGNACIVTRDVKTDRLNVHIENGKIIYISHFG
jgi:hypothetical protein